MPTINLPDGTILNFPDTMTPDQIRNALSGFQGSQPVQDQVPGQIPQDIPPDTPQGQEEGFLDTISRNLRDFTSEALNTATFGFSDVVAGAGAALAEELFGGEEADPAAAFNRPRQEREEFREENPITSGVASFIGAFVNPAGQRAGKFVTSGQGLLSTAGRSAAVGAGFGGGQAGGEFAGEALGQVLEGEEVDIAQGAADVGTATALGAGIGGAFPFAARGVKAGFSGIANTLRRFTEKGQGTRALRKVAEAMERDGLTPRMALERIEKLGPEAALLDVGPNSRALAFTVAGIPGTGKTKVTGFLRARQEGVRNPKTGVIEGGQVNRIQKHIDQLIKGNFFTERQQLANQNNSARFYDSAFASNQNIESKNIDSILKTPAGRQAFVNARKTIQNLRTNLSKVDPELSAQLKEAGQLRPPGGVGRGLKLQFLDQVKKEMFDLEQAAKTQFGKPTSKSRSISQLRRELIDELDASDVTAGKDYAQARSLAGDDLANQEALEAGSDFLSKTKFSNPEELGLALNEMSPEARHLFRVGAAQSLKGKLAEIVSRADASKKLIDIQSLERKIRLAFGDNVKFKQYVDLLENEKDLFRAVTDVLGNSKTAERGAALDDLALDTGRLAQGVRDLLAGDFISATRNIIRGSSERLLISPKETEKIADILLRRDVRGLSGQIPAPVSRVTETGRPVALEESLIRALSSTAGTRVDN